MKYLLPLFILLFSFSGVAIAAPYFNSTRTIIPEQDSVFDVGTSTKYYRDAFFKQVCLDGSCRTTWPSGGGGGGSISTSTALVNGRAVYATGVDTIGTDNAFLWDSSLDKLTVTNASTTNLTIGSLSGILKQVGGVVSAAVSNTDYQAPISLTTTGSSGAATFDGTTLNIPQYAGTTYTATYPVTLTGSAFGLAFGTSSSNTWGGTQTFTNQISGSISGNSGTASALAANGANCSAGSYPLGVDASGAVENCTDAWTEAENTAAAYTPQSRTLTVAGTANQITSSAGAQSLAANRTWTLSLPNHVIFPSSFQASSASTTNATSTNQDVTGLLTFNGVTGSTWSAFCTAITGGAGLCDGTDATGSGGAAAVATSSAETSTYVPFWTSTAGTPATLSGGSSNFTWNGTRLFAAYASSTALTVSGTASTTDLVISGLGTGANRIVIVNGTGVVSSVALPLTYANGGGGTISNSTSNLAYYGPTSLQNVATSSVTINAPLTTTGTPGALVGGTNLTIDIDDIKAADLDLTDITLSDFTNDAGYLTGITGQSIEDLSDVAAMTEDYGDLLYWNGSAWADIATSSLGITGGSGTVTGTTGQVAYLSGTDTAVGTSSIFIDTNQKVGIGQTSPTGKLHVENSTHTSNTVVINNGTTGAPPTIPNSYLPTLTVNVSQTSSSRPLFFGYTSGGAWTGYINVGGCGAFTTLCFNMGNGATDFTALKNNSTTLWVGGTANGGGSGDGDFTTVAFGNAGNVGIGTSTPYAKLSVVGEVVARNFTATSSSSTSRFEGIVQVITRFIGVIGSAFTPTTEGETGIDTTSNQYKYYSNGAVRVLGDGNFYPAFTYSTSTAWAGTTTIALGPAYTGETWNGVKCFTDTGTLFVRFTDGTNAMNAFQASTTVGTVSLSSNNTFTASEKRYVDIGTPASSPTTISCTVSKSITAD